VLRDTVYHSRNFSYVLSIRGRVSFILTYKPGAAPEAPEAVRDLPGYAPGGDPLPLLRRVPRAWTALSAHPRGTRKRGFTGYPREGSKKGFFGPFRGSRAPGRDFGPPGPQRALRTSPDPRGTAGPRREGLM